ncbi:MAG: TAXI family TRAP transporter solute-binding subunit [Syntrophomonadaceae bacterium]|nr:TAXI family TRAP transporter solute-binding subunit [Syntrophomonadaceae bacterium]
MYFILGNGMASMFQNRVPNIRASAQATEGSAQNMLLLRRGDVNVAFTMNQVAAHAYNGTDRFAGNPNKDLRVLTALYPNVVQIVARAGSGVRNVNDFFGKRFAPGAAGSGTELNTREVFGVHGIDYRDRQHVRMDYVGFTAAAELIRNGQSDGLLINAGIPVSALLDLATTTDVNFISLDQSRIDELTRRFNHYFPFTIPANTYRGQTDPVRTVGQANLLLTTANMPDDVAYFLTRAVFEHHADLLAVHSAARDITLQAALRGHMGIPLHPGAARYFAERGLRLP